MTNFVNVNIKIFDKNYSVRCPEAEVDALKEAAEFLNQNMTEVRESGKSINPERIAIITGINIAYKYLLNLQQKNNFEKKVSQRISLLQEKLDIAINQGQQTELLSF